MNEIRILFIIAITFIITKQTKVMKRTYICFNLPNTLQLQQNLFVYVCVCVYERERERERAKERVKGHLFLLVLAQLLLLVKAVKLAPNLINSKFSLELNLVLLYVN